MSTSTISLSLIYSTTSTSYTLYQSQFPYSSLVTISWPPAQTSPHQTLPENRTRVVMSTGAGVVPGGEEGREEGGGGEGVCGF